MRKENKVMLTSMIVNSFLSIIKIIVGLIGKSSALIADGIHSFSDLFTDVFAIFGNLLSRKPADEKHPFGHGKLEYLTSIGIGLVILFVGFSIIYNSYNTKIIIPSILVVLVSLFTIISKYLLAHYIIKKGKEYKNNILISSGKESSMDVLSSVVVLVATILMRFSSKIEILKYADKIATIIVGLFIIKVGFDVLKENISTILGEQEIDPVYLENIRKIITKEKEVMCVDELTLIKYGYYFKIVCEVGMNGNLSLKKSHDVLEKIEKELKKYDERNRYITIHVNPYGD